MKNPIIGISLFSESEKDINAKLKYYIEAVKDLGGIPVIFPILKEGNQIKKLIESCDGFIITGGNDINPSLYNEETKTYCMGLDKDRDESEKLLIEELMKIDKPLLAICRGFQILNVVLGGSLYQDIDIDIFNGDKANHRQEDKRGKEAHKINVNKGTLLHEVVKSEIIGVNTLHHQCLKKLGIGVVSNGKSEDGIVESYHIDGKKFVLGVQWHPELLYKDYEEQRKIFKAFIKSC